jgi:hypothetical protein
MATISTEPTETDTLSASTGLTHDITVDFEKIDKLTHGELSQKFSQVVQDTVMTGSADYYHEFVAEMYAKAENQSEHVPTRRDRTVCMSKEPCEDTICICEEI